MSKKITYDDTRDASIRVVENLIEQGFFEDNEDTYFGIQDTIQDEINKMLKLDIDDNFETKIFNQSDLETELFGLAEHYAMTSTKSEIDDFNQYIKDTYND